MQRILVALALQGCAAYVAPPTPRRPTILRDSPFDGIGDLLEQVAAPPEDSSLPSGSFGAVVTGGARRRLQRANAEGELAGGVLRVACGALH